MASEWWERAEARGEGDKRWDSLVEMWLLERMALWHLQQAWALAEVRTAEKQTDWDRIHEARVCRKGMAPGFLRTAGALCSIFVALLRRTLSRSSGFSMVS